MKTQEKLKMIEDAIENLRKIPDVNVPPDLRASIICKIQNIPQKRSPLLLPLPTAIGSFVAVFAILIVVAVYCFHHSPKEPYTKNDFISDSLKLARESYEQDIAGRKLAPIISERGRI